MPFIHLDGVAVVLYNMMKTFNEMNHENVPIDTTNIVLGLVSFLTISLGGLAIGIIHGFITALITKTTSQVRGETLTIGRFLKCYKFSVFHRDSFIKVHRRQITNCSAQKTFQKLGF